MTENEKELVVGHSREITNKPHGREEMNESKQEPNEMERKIAFLDQQISELTHILRTNTNLNWRPISEQDS